METRTRIPKVIAHRGGRQWAPENTMAAFRQALEAGCDGIELDVQRCATGELVVMHDIDIGRTTNGVGLVRDVSFAELKRLSAGSWFDREFAEERIPSLAEVLELVGGRGVLVNIEIKNTPEPYDAIEEDLVELLSGYQSIDKIVVSSFDHQLIKRLRELDDRLNLAVLVDGLLVDLPEYASKLGARYFHPCFDSINADAVDEAHDAGLAVNAWTLNSARDWAKAVKMGIDGIVTDDPPALLAFVERLKQVTEQVS